ncbi:hypothetical protein CIPAW_05G194100 [Carya illinoinensis]|uniref:Uncharacterized protein n=1 Tax=Carya illinoinensis TaxID=32201 RepID=A0A8T1QM84_CARIL|nr:hypothetical protein CIPAW_05G194100 [Carya illinoinensis]
MAASLPFVSWQKLISSCSLAGSGFNGLCKEKGHAATILVVPPKSVPKRPNPKEVR